MTTNKILAKYKNGNTKVIILEDGTKIRSYEGVPSPIFPESIDCKLTNFCDLGCAFCHENSTTEGKHADLEKLKEILDPLPPGIELACLSGDTVVYTENGTTEIKDLNVGDYIYDSKNNLVEVKNIQKSTKPLYRIKGNKGFDAKCTNDHPFMSNEKEIKAENMLGLNVDLLQSQKDYTQEDLKQLDLAKYVTIANPNKRGSRGGIVTEDTVKLNSSASHIPRYIKITKDLMWFYGLTVAEGSKKGLTLHINEEEYYLKCAEIYNNITGLGHKLYPNPEKNSIVIEFKEPKAFQSIFFEEMEIGYGARNKSLAFLFKIQNKELIRSAMEGLFDGDGSYRTRLINERFKSFNLTYKTSSKKLAYDMIYLLKRHFDITATIYHGWNKERKIEGRTLKPSDYYKIDIYNKEDILKLFPDLFKYSEDFNFKSKYSTKGGTRENCTVDNFEDLLIEETVYDITLSEDSTHVFPINGYFLTHNCGGGNPLDHPDLLDFLMWCKSKGFIANMTINQGHLEKFYWDIVHLITDDLIKGVGISITSKDYSYIEKLKKITNNIVYHLILGIHKPTIFDELEVFGDPKYLLLGYKTFGRGVKYFNPRVTKTINYWNQEITNLLNENKGVISFDNLAIEQLELESKLDSETWNKFYMGDDFMFTMYIDAVNQEYAPTSRSSYSERVHFKDSTLINYFKENRNV